MAKEDGLSIVPLLVDEEHFKGVNSKKGGSDSEIIMQERIKTKWMEQGVIMQLPSTIYIEEGVVLRENLSLRMDVVLQEKVRLSIHT